MTIALDILGIGGILAMIAMVAIHWRQLPSSIPIHYNFSGKVDAWGDKSMLPILIVLAAGLYTMLSFTMRNMPTLLPNVIRLHVVVIIGWLVFRTIQVALGRAEGIGRIFIIFVLVSSAGIAYATHLLKRGQL